MSKNGERVIKIIVEQLQCQEEQVKPEAKFIEDLGADSLDILQLLMRIEDQYGIVIPDQALASFETVADVVSYLEKQEVSL